MILVPHRCKLLGTDNLIRALIAIREGKQGDATHMFRSYNHHIRFGNNESELNPGSLRKRGTPKIWEACRASTAAPFYFKRMIIDGQKYSKQFLQFSFSCDDHGEESPSWK